MDAHRPEPGSHRPFAVLELDGCHRCGSELDDDRYCSFCGHASPLTGAARPLAVELGLSLNAPLRPELSLRRLGCEV